MQSKLSRTFEVIIVATVIAILGGYIFLSMQGYLADSEIWSVNLGYHFSDEWKHSWVYTRLFFYLPLYLATFLSSKATTTFYLARALMLVNVVVQVCLIQRILFSVTKSRQWSWVGLLFVVTNTFYITQSFRIRSDLVATTFLLGALATFYSGLSIRKKRVVIIGLLLMALLSTPKVIFIFPAILWVLSSAWPIKKRLTVLCSFFVAIFGAIAAGVFLRLGPFSDLVGNMVSYFLDAISWNQADKFYASREAFVYVRRFFSENYVFDAYVLMPFLLLHSRRAFSAIIKSEWFLAFILTLCALFFVPDKLPFFICSLVPILVISIHLICFQGIRSNSSFANQDWKRNFIWSLGSVFVVVMLFFSTLRAIKFSMNDNNSMQMDFISNFDRFLSENPKVTYYDVIGIVPARSSFRHFVGPHQDELNSSVSAMLVQARPDIILNVAKTIYFKNDFREMMNKDYLSIGNGIYARAKDVDLPATKENIRDNYGTYVKTKDTRYLFLSQRDYQLSQPKPDWRIKKISETPVPVDMPMRNLDLIFKYDTEF